MVTNTIMSDGTSFDSLEAIHEGAVNYFQDFLSDRYEGELPNLSLIIDKVISEE